MKPKTCIVCGKVFNTRNSLCMVCSPTCAFESVKNKKAWKKTKAKIKKAKKESLKTRSDHLKEAQTAFNAYIRYRDRDKPCISCGRLETPVFDAGHYRGRKAHPELRFEESNVFRQCRFCNTFMSGNLIEYRKNLVKRIGIKKVEWLEGHHPLVKLSIDEIKAIKKKYQDKLKEEK